jgi:hypothetical protein
MVTPPMVDFDVTSCPFDHDEPEPPTVVNDLVGVGTKLATKMKNGTGTHLYEKIKANFKPDKIENPRNVATHPFYNKKRCVEITASFDSDPASSPTSGMKRKASELEITHTYPVTCAAHHVIPAQESLKGSPLLTFMCKKGFEETLKDETYSDGIVWSGVGYDVNGNQNGIFLPGSYAVGGGRGGMNVWADNTDEDEDEPEDAGDKVADPQSNELTGNLYEIKAQNRKWLYVKQAVKLCPGQFHDRHVEFSKFIQEILEKIFENHRALKKSMLDVGACDRCKQRAELIKKHGIPAPYGLVQRLNSVSKRVMTFLDGKTWKRNIYTSGWGNAYMDAVLARNSDAD